MELGQAFIDDAGLGEDELSLGGKAPHEGLEALGEGAQAFVLERPGDGVEVDAQGGKGLPMRPGAGDVLFQAGTAAAVVAEGVYGGRRHGIDGVGSDELFYVDHVFVAGVLGAGGGPEQPLRLGALAFERGEARRGELLLVDLIGQLGVGDGGFAEQGGGAGLGLERAFKLLVDGAIHAADEETGHRGDPGEVLALSGAALQPLEIGLDDGGVALLREKKGDVHRQAACYAAFDGGQGGGGAGDLDHHVVAADGLVQAQGLGVAGRRVLRQGGRQFDGDVAVMGARLFVEVAEKIGGGPDVVDGELSKSATEARDSWAGRMTVVAPGADGLLEDAGLR